MIDVCGLPRSDLAPDHLRLRASFRVYGPKPGRVIATVFDEKSLVSSVQSSPGYWGILSRLCPSKEKFPERIGRTGRGGRFFLATLISPAMN
jgi:hypothetical protein